MFAVPALVAMWAVAGLYGALGPALVKLVSGSGSIVLGGLSLFLLAGSGAATVLLLQRQNARQLTLIGGGALLAGMGLTLLAVGTHSTAGFFVGTAIAGVGFGGAFQGAIRSVVPLAAPHQRAGVLSVVYVVSYLAMGLPAVIAGFLLVHEGNLVSTAVQFGVAVMVLAALALAGALRPARPARRRGPSGTSTSSPPAGPGDVHRRARLAARSRAPGRGSTPSGASETPGRTGARPRSTR